MRGGVGRIFPTPFRMGPRFSADQRGAAALEFAIVGPIFLALILSILEAGLLCTRMALLDHAIGRASKVIYIGPADGSTLTQDDIEQSICDEVGRFLSNCEDNVRVELTPISGFGSVPTTDAPCKDSDLEIEPAASFVRGGSSEIVFMRACLTVPVVTPGLGLGLNLSKTSTNKFQMVSSIAFVNEPF